MKQCILKSGTEKELGIKGGNKESGITVIWENKTI